MKKENITVLRKILYAVESGGQVYGKQNYGAFAGVGANTPNEKAITIGAGQWYAEEARTLLLNIQKKYQKEFKKLDTAGIAADLNKSWGTYGVTKTSAKGKCIIAIITSAVGIKCQDALMETQIKTYAASIEKKYGSLSDDAMMECINIIHQGGSGALTRILAKTQKYRYYPAYMLTLTTACRRGEILGLDWQHVDIGIPWTTVDRYFPWGDIKKLPKWDTKALKTLLEDHNITLGDGYLRLVYQMVDDNGTPFRDELKTDLSRRSLMITEEMVLLLIFWRLIQNTEKKKAAERGIEYNPDNLVFCTRKGTYIYPRNFTKMWSENLRSMGIDHKRFHDLRHTVATVMLEDGEAMNTVQEQLGHYDAGFTASRYGHVTAKMRNSAAVKLGERLEKVRNPEAEDAEDANSVKNEDTIIPFQEGRKLKSAACKIK